MDRLVYGIYLFLDWAVRLLSLPATFRLGQLLGILGYYVAIPYRRLALRNLRIAFGAEKSGAELRSISRNHFASLCGNLLSGLKIARLSPEAIRGLVTIEGWENLQGVLAGTRRFVSTISHLGNWELIAQLGTIFFPGPGGAIYQRLGNRFIDAEIRANRARHGVLLFERKEGFQGALKSLRDGGCVGVLVDQHAGDAGVWCPFFGRLASTSPLAATLALRAEAAILPITVHTVSPGRWRYVIDPPIETSSRDTDAITAAINLSVENQIRRVPSDWLWAHNRWKTPKPKFLLATYKRGVSQTTNPQLLQPFRILIRSSNWLGDAIMSIPAVRAIKRGRPDAHVTILTPAKLADVWKLVPEVDEVIAFPPERSVFGVAKSIRGRFEAAILFPNSFRTGLEAWLGRIPRRVGYPGHRRAWMLNQVLREKKKKAAQAPRHQVYQYLRLAEFVGAAVEEEGTEGTEGWNAGGNGVPGDAASPGAPATPLRLAVCPGAEYGVAKRWQPERFAEVMSRVAAARPCEWIMVGVAKDAEIGESIARQFTGTLRNLIGKTTLAELIAELRACDLLLTNDTGTMHLAAFLGVPVVAIFGSTEPALTGPQGVGHVVVRHHVACSPCFLRECPIDFRCMDAVKVDEVVGAVEKTLGGNLGI